MGYKERVVFVLITGLPCAGKSTLRDGLVAEGLPAVSIGDVARQESEGTGMTPREWGAQFGSPKTGLPGCIPIEKAIKCYLGPQSASGDTFVIEGIRRIEEIECARGYPGARVLTVACIAPMTVLLDRCRARGRETTDEWYARVEEEVGWGALDAIQEADYFVVTKTTPADITSDVKEIIRRAKIL